MFISVVLYAGHCAFDVITLMFMHSSLCSLCDYAGAIQCDHPHALHLLLSEFDMLLPCN